jgi:putative glycosyltransferase
VLNRQSGGDSTALLDRLDDRPLIFIYTSVGAIPPKLYSEIIARAFGDGEFNVLCSLGFHYEREDIITDLPENIRFVQYINIEDVMPHCAVVVFHGGQDMMLTSLIHEKPSICIPGKHFERSFNAQQMQRNQLAYWMSIYELRPRKLKRLVQMAMDEIDRERLHLFSKKITEYHGNQRCVAILDGLL